MSSLIYFSSCFALQFPSTMTYWTRSFCNRHLSCSDNLLHHNMLQWTIPFILLCTHVSVNLHDKFPKVESLSNRACMFQLLTDTAKTSPQSPTWGDGKFFGLWLSESWKMKSHCGFNLDLFSYELGQACFLFKCYVFKTLLYFLFCECSDYIFWSILLQP